MKPIHAVLIVISLQCLSGLGIAQTSPQSAPSPADESSWLPTRVLTAPARAIGKVLKTPSTSTKPEETEAPGFVAFAQFQGSATPLGTVMAADLDVGYQFTPHVTGEAGLPIFFVRSPFSAVANRDWNWEALLADPYVDVRYATTFSGAHITSILTGTIPVSNARSIYSAGRFGVDWFNHLEGTYKIVSPFVNFGAANGTINRFIIPRPYSMGRPYQTFGFISDFEGGMDFQIARGLKIGGSAYALVPGGPQKMYSRLVAPNYSLAGDSDHNRYFYSAFLTMGNSNLTRDNGFSGWVEVAHIRHVTLQVGYTRSVRYAYDSWTLMLNFNGTFLVREPTE